MKKVIITGMHRSGTTFIGRAILNIHKDEFIHEPYSAKNSFFPSQREHNWYGYNDKHSKMLAAGMLKSRINSFRKRPLDIKNFKIHKNIVVKDPFIIGSLGNFLEHDNSWKVVATIRPPLAVLISCREKGWLIDPKKFFSNYASNEFLPIYLRELIHLFQTTEVKSQSKLTLLLWVILNEQIHYLKSVFPDKIEIVDHTKISVNPTKEFEKIMDFLNQRMSKDVIKKIEAMTSTEVRSRHAGTDIVRDSQKLAFGWKDKITSNDILDCDDIRKYIHTNELLKFL